MTKKTKLIPFDWDLYKAGAKVLCRHGKVLHIFNNSNYMQYLILYEKDGEVSACSINGCSLKIEEELEERTFYLNVYSGGIEPYRYESLEYARDTVRKDNDFYQGTLKVTYTDEDLIK